MPADQDIKATTRRVILHCGVQKTASTSLHRYLARNHTALSKWIEVQGPVRQTLVRDMGHTAMQFSLDPSTDLEDRLVGILQALRDELMTGTSPVLISHENLFGAMIGKGGVVTLYPWMERIIELVNTHLAPLMPEFVYYTREMSFWKHSVYGQAVTTDHYRQTRDVFLDETANCGSWDDMHQRLIKLVGKHRVQTFRLEDETDERRPGTQLLRFAGLTVDDIAALDPMHGRRNLGQNVSALEFLRLVNTLGLARRPHDKIVGLIASNQSLFAARST